MWKVLRDLRGVKLVLGKIVVFPHTFQDAVSNAHIARIASAFVKVAGSIDILIRKDSSRLTHIENDNCKVVLVDDVDGENSIALVMCKDDDVEEKLCETIVEELSKRIKM